VFCGFLEGKGWFFVLFGVIGSVASLIGLDMALAERERLAREKNQIKVLRDHLRADQVLRAIEAVLPEILRDLREHRFQPLGQKRAGELSANLSELARLMRDTDVGRELVDAAAKLQTGTPFGPENQAMERDLSRAVTGARNETRTWRD
jgi:hypothetical protein